MTARSGMDITIVGEDEIKRPLKFWRPNWRDNDAKAAELEHAEVDKVLREHHVGGYTVSTVKVEKSPIDPKGYYIDVVLYGHVGAIPNIYPVRMRYGNDIRIKYTCK
jgi:hypothetical protein